tara:strand:- start:450 stop:4193 length:3744 start_codon:yes stop_codon:yes gene_type:complete
MKKILSLLILNIFVFASSSVNSVGGAKSHSIELLHWGRHTPMSFHENTLISSKSFVSSKSRSVQVYNIENDGVSSLLQNLSSPNPSAGDDFGFSIDHNDNYLIIGSPGFNEGNGAAYLYKKKSNQWVYESTFLNPEIQSEGRPHKFGYSVNLNDKYLSISSPFNKDGIVYIYSIEQQIAEDKVTINSFKTIDVQKIGNVAGCYSEGPDRFAFGLSSSMNDKYLLIGSLKDFAYLVTFNNNEASGESFIFPSNEIDKDDDINEKLRFAESVYVGEESIYISSLGYNHDSGAVLKYDKLQNNLNWFLSDFIIPESDQNHHHRSDDLENNYFGFRITETNNKVFISSFNNPKIHKYSKNKYNLTFENHFGNNVEELDKYSSRNIVAENDILVSDAYYSEKMFIHNVTNNRSNNSLNEILTSESRNSIFSKIKCENGYAGNYQCNKIDLMSYIDKTEIGGINSTILNDIWGWTDPQTGKEYALVGMSNGTSFVDISNPELPVFIGRLPTQTSNSTWRDIKVYNNHAFIVSEAGGHGMQVFDLTELRSFDGSPAVNFSNTAYYNGFGNAHNIFINEDTGFAYAIGTTTCGPGGLHIVDINSPKSPVKSACISDPNTGRNGTGYVHDVQCVVYNGPDSAYVGKEICFGSNETHVWITDVSVKSDDNSGSKTIGLGSYNSYYTHQGWLTDDHKYLIVNDELDESNNATGGKTRTLIWDVQDLNSPTLFKVYYGPNSSIDHNNYVVGDEVYMSHYSSGLRVLDISDIANPSEKAFFDVHPSNNNVNFDGSWSNYPFFDSKNIIVTAIDDGLFVVQKSSNLSAPSISVSVPQDGSVLIRWQFNDSDSDKIKLYRSTVQSFNPSPSNLIGEFDRSTNSYLDSNLNSQTNYYYKAISLSGSDEGPVSSEIVVLPTFIPNIQPTIDSISDLVIDEDITASITLTGISYGSDINNQQVTVDAIASDASLIKDLIINPDPLDDSEYTLTIIPKENMYGSTNIVVIVSDDGGTLAGGIDHIEVYFNLTINSINDYPTSATQVGELVVSSNEYLMYSSIEGLNRYLSIDINNISDSLRFEWNESIDVDGDEVKYKLIGYEDLSFLSMDEFSTENSKTWAFSDIIAQTDTVSIYSGYWRVISTDGELNILSNPLSGKLFIDGMGLIPEDWGIKQSYPNPFRVFTTIEYEVPTSEKVVIKIYNVRGQTIKTLVNEKVSAGYQTVVWDGTNDSGDEVSSGIYFCQIFTPNSSSTKFKKAIKLTKLR